MVNTELAQPNNNTNEQRDTAKVDIRSMDARKTRIDAIASLTQSRIHKKRDEAIEAGYELETALKRGDQSEINRLKGKNETIVREMQGLHELGDFLIQKEYISGKGVRHELGWILERRAVDSSSIDDHINLFFARSVTAGGIDRTRAQAQSKWYKIKHPIDTVKEFFSLSQEELDRRYDVTEAALYSLLIEKMGVVTGSTDEEKRQNFDVFVREMIGKVEPAVNQIAVKKKLLFSGESIAKTILFSAMIGSAFTPAAVFAVPSFSLLSYGYGKYSKWRRNKEGSTINNEEFAKKKSKILKNKKSSEILTRTFFQKIGDKYEQECLRKFGMNQESTLDLDLLKDYSEVLTINNPEQRENLIQSLVGGEIMAKKSEELLIKEIESNSGVDQKIEEFDRSIGSTENSFWLDKIPFVARWATYMAIASKDLGIEKVVSDSYLANGAPLFRAIVGGIAGYKLSDRLNIALRSGGIRSKIRGMDRNLRKILNNLEGIDEERRIDEVLQNADDRAKVKAFLLSEIAGASRKDYLKPQEHDQLEKNKKALEVINLAEIRHHEQLKAGLDKVIGSSEDYSRALEGLYKSISSRDEAGVKLSQKARKRNIEDLIVAETEKFHSRKLIFRVGGTVVGALAPFIIRHFLGSFSGESSDAKHRASASGDDAPKSDEASSLTKDKISKAGSSVEGAGEKEAPSVDKAEHAVKKGVVPSKEVAVEDAVTGPRELKWADVDKNAVVKQNEGVWHAVKRQIEGDNDIRKALGLTESATKDEINRATAKLLVDNDYIKPDHTEVRVLKADAVAYDAKVVNDKVVISELHSVAGKAVEGSKGIDKAFEYSYKQPIKPVELSSLRSGVSEELFDRESLRIYGGHGEVALGSGDTGDSLLLFDDRDSVVRSFDIADGVAPEKTMDIMQDVKMLEDYDGIKSFTSALEDSGYGSYGFESRLDSMTAQQEKVFEEAFGVKGFDKMSLRFNVDKEALMDFTRNHNTKTIDIFAMISGDQPIPKGCENLIKAARGVIAERIDSYGAGYTDLVNTMVVGEINDNGLIQFLNENYTDQRLMDAKEFRLLEDSSVLDSSIDSGSSSPDLVGGEEEAITRSSVELPANSKAIAKTLFELDDRKINQMLSERGSLSESLDDMDGDLKKSLNDTIDQFKSRASVVEKLATKGETNIPGLDDFRIISNASSKPAGEVYNSLFKLMGQEKELDKFLEAHDENAFTRDLGDIGSVATQSEEDIEAERRKKILEWL